MLKNEIALTKAIKKKAEYVMDELAHHDKMRAHHKASALRLLHDKSPSSDKVTLGVAFLYGDDQVPQYIDTFSGSPLEVLNVLLECLNDGENVILNQNDCESKFRITVH